MSHLVIDLGRVGGGNLAVIELDNSANVWLMTKTELGQYQGQGLKPRRGGGVTSTPVSIPIPILDDWCIVVERYGLAAAPVNATVRVEPVR